MELPELAAAEHVVARRGAGASRGDAPSAAPENEGWLSEFWVPHRSELVRFALRTGLLKAE